MLYLALLFLISQHFAAFYFIFFYFTFFFAAFRFNFPLFSSIFLYFPSYSTLFSFIPYFPHYFPSLFSSIVLLYYFTSFNFDLSYFVLPHFALFCPILPYFALFPHIISLHVPPSLSPLSMHGTSPPPTPSGCKLRAGGTVWDPHGTGTPRPHPPPKAQPHSGYGPTEPQWGQLGALFMGRGNLSSPTLGGGGGVFGGGTDGGVCGC